MQAEGIFDKKEYIMERIEKLRLVALDHCPVSDGFYLDFYKKYTSDTEGTEGERYARAFHHAFCSFPPVIGDNELIVGESINTMTPEEQTEWDEKYYAIARARVDFAGHGQDSHMAIDYELVLEKGLYGIIGMIDKYLKKCDEDKKEFYLICKECLDAVIIHSENYSAKAKELAEKETNEKRKNELLKIAEMCKKVPAYPAESFYEAVQCVHFISYCISMNPFRMGYQQFQLGHPDRYLLPYYENDIKNGIITKEYAQLLLDCLGIQINMRDPNGLSCGYMVGGRDENGKAVANELTEMLMQVIDDIRLVYPSVGLCYNPDIDDKYLEKACTILTHGRSHPAIFGDDTVAKGLLSYGLSKKEAYNYIHSTCVEITPVGSSNVWVASPYTNMAQLLLDIMDKEYESFDALLTTLFAYIDSRIENNCRYFTELREIRKNNSRNPLLSCFVNDCLERGTDIEHGGARYNWIMPSFVGMANLVDSLYAIKTLVFEEKRFGILKFKEILDGNFENENALRLYILNNIPKYGNDIDDVDKLFGMMTEHISEECKKYHAIHTNARFIPSVFCWIMHDRFGRETIATPDGRCAFFPLGDGSGPCQGREMNGPTASIISSTKWAHHEYIGGVAVNMKFSKKSLGQNSVETMKNLVKTYINRGGFEMQINVVDKATLQRAVEHPEEYKDLVVRIGGYSDYFTRLSPEMQQEVILRTEHTI